MSACVACGVSVCLDCKEPVDILVWRCEPCRVVFDENDLFAKTAREQGERADAWQECAIAARACLEYMSGPATDKELGELVGHKYNEAFRAANELEEKHGK